MNGKDSIPSWPRYHQISVTTAPYLLTKVGLAAAVVFLGSRYVGVTFSFVLLFLILALPELALWFVNSRIQRAWRAEAGGAISWARVRELVGDDAEAWIVVGHCVPSGMLSFGTYLSLGGRDSVLLVDRESGRWQVIDETSWTNARQEARACGLESHEGGLVTSDRVSDLVEGLRAGDEEAEARLAEVDPKAAEIAVPELASLVGCDLAPDAPEGEPGALTITASMRAIRTLARIGVLAKPAIPALIEVARSEDERHASLAVWALGQIGPAASQAVPAILERIDEVDVNGRQRRFQALQDIGPGASAALPFLLECLESRTDLFWVVLVLREIGAQSAEALPALRTVVADRQLDSSLRSLARDAIRSIETPP